MEPTEGAPPRSVPISMGSPRFRSFEVAGFLATDAWFPPHLRLPPHIHDRASFAVMLEGSFDLSVANRTQGCPPGSVFTEPAAERHANRIESAGARVLVVQADPSRPDLTETCGPLLERVHHFRHGGIAGLASRLAREIESPDAATPLAVEGAILEMLAAAARMHDVAMTGRRPPEWLGRVRDLIHARFLDRLRTADLAREAGVHPVHMARVFRAHHGMSIETYLRTLRLDWAGNRLTTTRDPLIDIALEAGFSDQSHFTRAFRQHTGSTPDRFRRRTNRQH